MPDTTAKFRPSFRKLADQFLVHAEQTKEKPTFELQRYFLQSFCDSVKKKLACDLKVADVPGAWNELYRHYLGVTPKDDAEGCLQDGHWGAGQIGYFPTYTL